MYDSHYWDWELGVCKKHWLPSVPCPACIAEPIDKDVFVVRSKIDAFVEDLESKETGD